MGKRSTKNRERRKEVSWQNTPAVLTSEPPKQSWKKFSASSQSINLESYLYYTRIKILNPHPVYQVLEIQDKMMGKESFEEEKEINYSEISLHE
jgi:hypothetical protein